MSCIRQRSDTDASIEIYGSDQKVKFNSSSNTIEVSLRGPGLNNKTSTEVSQYPHTVLLGKSDRPNRIQNIQNGGALEPSSIWMDSTGILQSPLHNVPHKKSIRRPPNLPRQTSFGKRKDGEKDLENGSIFR